jgi:hypothetical protein
MPMAPRRSTPIGKAMAALYGVRIEGNWYDVPDDAIINEPNRNGRTIVWPMHVWEGEKLTIAIRCFMPGINRHVERLFDPTRRVTRPTDASADAANQPPRHRRTDVQFRADNSRTMRFCISVLAPRTKGTASTSHG